MRKLYKFFVDCGRMGEISGLFISDEDDVKAAIGKELWIQEPLGKHSDVDGKLEPNEITEITDDQHTIDTLHTAFGVDTICGINPLHHLNED
jgi:hypothetical protein